MAFFYQKNMSAGLCVRGVTRLTSSFTLCRACRLFRAPSGKYWTHWFKIIIYSPSLAAGTLRQLSSMYLCVAKCRSVSCRSQHSASASTNGKGGVINY